MSDLTNKDAEQDTKIAVMDSTLENAIRRIEMVHSRIDNIIRYTSKKYYQTPDNTPSYIVYIMQRSQNQVH